MGIKIYAQISKAVDYIGQTLLHKAAFTGNVPVVRFLIKKGADVNARDRTGSTPLHAAALEYSGEKIVWENHVPFQLATFAGKVAQDDDYDVYEARPVTVKSRNANEDKKLAVIKLLVKNGADVNAKCNDGVTPLFFAAVDGRLKIVKYLVSKGAKFDIQLADAARRQGHTDVAEYLSSLK